MHTFEIIWRPNNTPPDRVEYVRASSDAEARYNLMKIHGQSAFIVSVKQKD